jgi:phosphoglycerate dehydrogenase-like enzyme
VNTARAAAVDYDALLRELQTGRITAALDVFPLPEPLAEESPFRKLPNVILSPHAAGLTAESLLRIGETVADEFVRFFAGQPLRYGVTSRHATDDGLGLAAHSLFALPLRVPPR